MFQSYENRGKLAFVEDQVQLAAVAFQAGEEKDFIDLMASTREFIAAWLPELGKG